MKDESLEASLPASSRPPTSTHRTLQFASFVGRERELAAVLALLTRADVRLLTLVGPGGTGKTRLALECVQRARHAFPDGSWIVELAAVADPALFMTSIAGALGLGEGNDRPLVELVAEFFADKRALLVLDNVEQLLSAAPLLGQILECAPSLTCLVTSRAPLRLYGEHQFPVPPLALPDLARPPTLETLAAVEAVHLFLERVRSLRPDFALTAANAPAVAEICVRLDGLPLAIELAAARCTILTPQAILARLTSRLALLTHGAQALPPRQQTLRGAIDWSYQLLDADEQRLFQRLAVFSGGWDLEAAEAICADGLAGEVLDGLAALVDKSLVRPADSRSRFAMLETIREYALERLGASGEEEVLRQRHAAYFVALAEQAHLELRGPQQAVWLDRLQSDLDNLRAVFQWSLSGGDPAIGVQLGGALKWFWNLRSAWREGQHWLGQVLAQPHTASLDIHARALNTAVMLAWAQNDLDRVRSLAEELMTLCRENGNQLGEAAALSYLSTISAMHEDFAQAELTEREVLALARTGNDPYFLSATLTNLGMDLLCQGKVEEAGDCFRESLALDRELEDQQSIAISQMNLGLVALWEQDAARAEQYFTESVPLLQALGDYTNLAACLEGMAGVASVRGAYERAAQLFGAAETLRQSVRAPLLPTDARALAPFIEATRSALGEADFAAALAAGRLLSPEAALAAPEPTLAPQGPVAPPPPTDEDLAPLSAREREVLQLVAQGLTNGQIAEQLVLSPFTVNAHLRSLYSKLGLANRNALVRFAVEHGLG